MSRITARVELYDGATWVDLTPDVIDDVKASWGLSGCGPTDRVADPGTLAFELDNNTTNLGGVRGYYTPGHPSAMPGFALGAQVRLVLVHDFYGEKVRWWGTIDAATPKPGAQDPRTTVSCIDWMDEAARAKLQGLTVQANVQSDTLFQMIVAASERQPPAGIRAGSGSDIYPYALDNVQDESSKVLSEFQKIALSEIGLVYVTAGALVFEGRKVRGAAGSVRLALDEDTLTDAAVVYTRDDVVNRVQVSIHPRRVDSAATTVLFNLGSSIQIARMTSVQINCPYRDPNQQAQRVGGKDMVVPVATTDYLGNTAADGSGADITAQLSATYVGTPGGNTAAVEITNNGPLDGYVTFLQLRGRGLYDFEPVISDVTDAESVDAYGENVLAYDMPYQSSPANALDTAMFILNTTKDAAVRCSSATFVGDWSDELVEQAFNLDVSHRVSVTLAEAGLDAAEYYVNGVQLVVRRGGPVVVTLSLAPVSALQVWLLEVAGRSELGVSTTLGYGLFAPGWILGTSALDTDTFLN